MEDTVIQDDEPVVLLVSEAADDVAGKPPSLADQLRARRTEIAETKTVMLPLTGYETHGVFVQHRLMDRAEVELIGRKIMGETRDRTERNMRILLDVIINSTSGFYRKVEDMEEEEPILDDRLGDEPIYGWDGFADYLGWQHGNEGTARGALYYVFGDNEFAIGQYGISLNRWMGNTGLKVDDEFLGEAL